MNLNRYKNEPCYYVTGENQRCDRTPFAYIISKDTKLYLANACLFHNKGLPPLLYDFEIINDESVINI